MGLNVGGGDRCYVECDRLVEGRACRERTEDHHGQNETHDWATRQGWQKNYDTGKWTCPKCRLRG